MPNNKSRQSKRKSRSSSGRVSTKTTKNAKIKQLASHNTLSMNSRVQGNVFPTRLRRTLRYSDAYQLGSTTGSIALQQFKVNSCYDIDNTSSGHQPRGFDQLCSATGPYKKYRVHAVRVALEFDTQNDGSTIIAAGFSDLAGIPTVPSGGTGTIAANAELPGWRSALIAPTGGPMMRMEFQSDICDIESVPRATVASEDNYSSTYAADPVDLAYLSVQMQAANSGTTTSTFIAHFELDVEFEEPILLASS